jgi:hypothetical protein
MAAICEFRGGDYARLFPVVPAPRGFARGGDVASMAYVDTLDLLRGARRFLADEGNWCRGHVMHPRGRGKSILGAVGNRLYMTEHPATREAMQLLARAIGGRQPL